MWIYEKKLQYPVRVSKCNPQLAKFLIEQYGGADGELAAALRYLNQRYTIPDKVKGLLTELAHLEMIKITPTNLFRFLRRKPNSS